MNGHVLQSVLSLFETRRMIRSSLFVVWECICESKDKRCLDDPVLYGRLAAFNSHYGKKPCFALPILLLTLRALTDSCCFVFLVVSLLWVFLKHSFWPVFLGLFCVPPWYSLLFCFVRLTCLGIPASSSAWSFSSSYSYYNTCRHQNSSLASTSNKPNKKGEDPWLVI